MYQTEWAQFTKSESINSDLHGGNFVATANFLTDDSVFSDAALSLGITNLRFPGGDLVERHFDPGSQDWNSWFNSQEATFIHSSGREFATVNSFLEHATSVGAGVTFCVPTANLVIIHANGSFSIDQTKVDLIADKMGSIVRGDYGRVQLDAIEIGNEYYLDGRMTAEQYGAVANKLTSAIHDAIESAIQDRDLPFEEDRPEIIVQAGAAWQRGDNEIILKLLDDEAKAAIDGVVIHWYPRDLSSVGRLDGQFKILRAWEQEPGFGELNSYITEWNIHNVPAGDKGMLQASTLISGYERIVIEDIDHAHFWGIEFDRLRTRLSYERNSDEPDEDGVELTPSGEVIRSLFNSTVGLSVLDLPAHKFLTNISVLGQEDTDYTVTSFGNADRAIIYVASRDDESDTLDLDVGNYFNGAHYVVVERFSVVDDPTTSVNEGDPLIDAARSSVSTTTYTADQLDDIQIDIGPYEILRIEVAFGRVGVDVSGQNTVARSGLQLDDVLVGSDFNDTIHGFSGNDTLSGNNGRDYVDGGTGDDQLHGGGGNDLLLGGAGLDTVHAGQGGDIVFGGRGDDSIFGQGGDDLLFGGEGANTLSGGEGDDTIISNGSDVIEGGNGKDAFSISTAKTSIVLDWSPESAESISFQGAYADPENVRARMIETANTDGSPGDIVIRHDSGEETIFRGAAGHSEQFIAQLADHSEDGDFTIAQADLLSGMTVHQIEGAFGTMSSEEYAAYTHHMNPTLLFQNIDGSRIAGVLNSLNAVESRELLSSIRDEDLQDIIAEMDRAETSALIMGLDDDALSAVLNALPGAGFGDIAVDFDDIALEKLSSFYSRDYGNTDNEAGSAASDLDWWNALTTQPGGSPFVPPVEEDSESTPGEEGEGNPSVIAAASCFIASAVYANPQHPSVWLLRWYRDEVLRKYRIGRVLINIYWIIGPFLAQCVSKNEILVRFMLVILEFIVRVLCSSYQRKPGRQADHMDHPDSRLIKIGIGALRQSVKRRIN